MRIVEGTCSLVDARPRAPSRNVSVIAVEHADHAELGLRIPITNFSDRRKRDLYAVARYLLCYRPRHVAVWLPPRDASRLGALTAVLALISLAGVTHSHLAAPCVRRCEDHSRRRNELESRFLRSKGERIRESTLLDRIGWLNTRDSRLADSASRRPIEFPLGIRESVDAINALAETHERLLVLSEWCNMRMLLKTIGAKKRGLPGEPGTAGGRAQHLAG